MIVHTYPPLLQGTLIKRYKRFFADIELSTGELITAHCANTGPMTGISTLGSTVAVSVNSDPKRKLKYSWEMILVGTTWVGINTAMPNRVIARMLAQHLLPELEPYEQVRPEVPYGSEKSRIDFVLTHQLPESKLNQTTTQTATQTINQTATQTTFVEIKSTTWSQDNLVLFPDTVTTRGQKHLRELMAICTQEIPGDATLNPKQIKSVLIYFINRGDCDYFSPGDNADPEYGRLLRAAIAVGVKVLPCRFNVTPETIEYLGLAQLEISSKPV